MRLFFGLSLPDEIRAEAARCALDAQQTIPGRYSPMENYHITLAFIGDVPQERLPDAQAVLSKTIARFPAPRITLDKPGHFGRAQNGILILHAKAKPALAPLHDALVKNLNAAALPADPGPFSPHITLARISYYFNAFYLSAVHAFEFHHIQHFAPVDIIYGFAFANYL